MGAFFFGRTTVLSIRDGEALSRALRSDIDHHVKHLLRQRSQQLDGIDDQAYFAIVEPGDTPIDLERTIGFSILQNPADGTRCGDPDFTVGWEWIEDHGCAYELCFIFDDSGFAHGVIVPKDEGINPDLTAFCKQYAA